MAKNFPRIYSLSLVGIKKHYHVDYVFHPFRTDFSGDSGIGKSIIADALQLIFVGKSEFRPATESTDGRHLHTLTVDRYGYIFINAEVAAGQFLVMGMFLSGPNAEPFIVQGGYDWENYTPLEHPFSYKEVLMEGSAVPDIDALTSRLDGKYSCRKMFLKKYHEFLVQNELLPVNIHTPGQLKSFAQVIRSFSHGRGFKYDSESLKDFFFGENKGKEIYEKFQRQLEEMDNDLKDHVRYQHILQEVSEKEQYLIGLKEAENAAAEAERVYREAMVVTAYRTVKVSEQKVEEKKRMFQQLAREIIHCETVHWQEELKGLEKAIGKTESQQKLLLDIREKLQNTAEKQNEYEKIIGWVCEKYGTEEAFRKRYTEALEVEKWLEKYRELEQLRTTFAADADNRRNRRRLTELVRLFKKEGFWEDFCCSEWAKDIEVGDQSFQEKCTELDGLIKRYHSLKEFADIENPHSLSAWALQNAWEMNGEEESVLVHFQQLKTCFPEKYKEHSRYLPQPALLLKQLKVYDPDEQGFWIELNGIREYVKRVTERFFNTADKEELRRYFKEHYQQADAQLQRLENQKKRLVALAGLIGRLGKEQVQLYNVKDEIEGFENELLFENKTEQDFDRQLEEYDWSASIRESYQHYFQLKKSVEEQEKEVRLLKYQLDEIVRMVGRDGGEDMDGLYQSLMALKARQEKRRMQAVRWLNRYRQLAGAVEERVVVQEQGLEKWLARILDLQRQKKSLRKEIIELEGIVVTQQAEYKRLLLLYKDWLPFVFKMDLKKYEGRYADLENVERRAFEDRSKEYERQYRTVVEKYIDRKGWFAYENSHDFLYLSRAILPKELVDRIVNHETEVLKEIREYLEEITGKYVRLGERKLNILGEIFVEVRDMCSRYILNINEIKNFLRNNESKISQGLKVKIDYDYSDKYPIEWIDDFLRQLDERVQDIGLNTGLFGELLKEVDIAEMMFGAYQRCGGKAKQAEIKDLLDPLRYFDIFFKLETEDGEANGGSSGQTYAAAALLCIARLSLIEKQENLKEKKGLRFMPVDEGESAGSNFYLLEKIAAKNDYQIVLMAMNPLDDYGKEGRYQYFLSGQSGGNSRICVNAVFDEGSGVEKYSGVLKH
ncbi:hypothetical protein [Culturomica massiliensis]|jgi:exonuclease SbcC|uniref:hypothetical protein n=1 Tax=Culturomica massiliensis TaxID=1841857 RepID=UPI000E559302|nr:MULTISPECIES: hypothetical protein [Odoribacteraceae]RHV92971.1 hypothetical protein DXA95_11455 [Odoribacter sp. OF09-27XD]